MIHPDHASLLIYKYQEKVKSKLSFILLIYPFCFHPGFCHRKGIKLTTDLENSI